MARLRPKIKEGVKVRLIRNTEAWGPERRNWGLCCPEVSGCEVRLLGVEFGFHLLRMILSKLISLALP